jgi:hypothetical protein
MEKSRYMNPAQVLAESLTDLYTSNLTMNPRPGLNQEQRETVKQESEEVYSEIQEGNLDFVTDTLASHIILLNNVVAVCHRKAKGSGYFKEFTELSIKATDQLRKSALALAQIKNVIVNIESVTLQQNNYMQLNQQQSSPEVIDAKTVVTAKA